MPLDDIEPAEVVVTPLSEVTIFEVIVVPVGIEPGTIIEPDTELLVAVLL